MPKPNDPYLIGWLASMHLIIGSNHSILLLLERLLAVYFASKVTIPYKQQYIYLEWHILFTVIV